jgi:hypothetical protein
MKQLFLLPLVTLASMAGFSQVTSQVQAKRGVFTERLYLADRWIDRVTPNMFSSDSTSDNIVPTAKAVSEFFRNKSSQRFAQTATVTVTPTTTETSLVGPGTGSLTIPASAWVPGKTYRITIYGSYNSVTAPRFLLRLKMGDSTIATTPNDLFNAGSGGNQFTASLTITCRTTGPSGTVYAIGYVTIRNQLYPWNRNLTSTGRIDASGIDTTTNQTINFTVQLDGGSNSSSNSISSYILTLEEVN